MKNNLVKSISRYIQHQSWPKELTQLFVSILKKLVRNYGSTYNLP